MAFAFDPPSSAELVDIDDFADKAKEYGTACDAIIDAFYANGGAAYPGGEQTAYDELNAKGGAALACLAQLPVTSDRGKVQQVLVEMGEFSVAAIRGVDVDQQELMSNSRQLCSDACGRVVALFQAARCGRLPII